MWREEIKGESLKELEPSRELSVLCQGSAVEQLQSPTLHPGVVSSHLPG